MAHAFTAKDGAFSITLDRKNITITTTRQLTVYDIEELEEQLHEVNMWAMADAAFNRATYGDEDDYGDQDEAGDDETSPRSAP